MNTPSQTVKSSSSASVPNPGVLNASLDLPAAPSTTATAPLLTRTEKQTTPSKGPSCGRAKLKRNCSKIQKYLYQACFGQPAEGKKIAVTSSLKAALLRCCVHVVPIGTTVVLAYLNFGGYFIGDQFAGNSSSTAQSTDQLCLQVTAKLIVEAPCSFIHF
jgi:hypothetical protein